MGSGLATRHSEAGPRGERTRRSAKDLRTAGKRGRDPARDVDSALCLGIAQLWPEPPTVGQNNPVATKNHGGLDGKARHPPPPPAVTTPNIPLPRSVWQAYQLAEQWCWERWHQLHGGPPPTTQTQDPDPGGGDNWKPSKMPYRSALRLHAGLSKAQSSILTQVRTGEIGLAAFLCKRRVPGFPTPACSCGAPWETAKHVVLDCPRLLRARRSLYLAAATTDYQALTSQPRPTAALTAWILRQGILPQFSWAQEQLEAGC